MVLAQVRFSPILKMVDFVPTIQEELRRKGYPRFQSLKTQEIVLGSQPEFRQSERWLFTNKEKTESVVLANNFVVLETSRYSIFEDFTANLKAVLDTVGPIIEAELVHRLGLRYVDLIVPQDGESLDDYLQPKLQGLQPDDLAIDKVLNHFESRAQTPLGQLKVRLHQNDSGMYLPPDLQPTELAFSNTAEKNTLVTLLDIDHFSEDEREYDVPALIGAMWELHEFTEKAFRSSVTDTALQRWEKE